MDNFIQFYEKTKKGFYQYLLSLTHDSDLADDIFQEAYLKIFKHYSNSFSVPLLYRIGKNIFIDEYNRTKNNVDHSEVVIEFNPDNDLSLEIDKVLSFIDEEDRQLFLMSVVDGMKYDEISYVTGLSISSIKVRVFRARKKIQEIIKGR
ncbi:MAG: RNA polymerase sigma factor [Calditerrivibrio sp.]|nr:RNA polymerase sigma factor [Calditerrivibrio sp.]